MSDDPKKPLVTDLTGLGEIANSKVANKAYDDAISPLMKELAKLGEDVVKTGRLILAPIQILSWGQDRFAKWMKELADDVPEERRQEAPAHIAGPVLRNLVYMEEDNPLARLYVELLKRAIDKERCDEAHPAFTKLIEQLSPDEAIIMWVLSNHTQHDVVRFYADEQLCWVHDMQDSLSPKRDLDYYAHFASPQMLLMYCRHLLSLGLLYEARSVYVGPVLDVNTPNGGGFSLTDFGQLFINACIPDDFSLPTKSNE